MNTIVTLGKGKLTYTLAVLGISYSIISLIAGNGDQDTNIGILWSSLALFGVRRAIGNK